MDGPGSAARLPRPRGSGGSPAALRAALEASLAGLYPRFAAAGAEGGPLSRAAEWLLDNTHVVDGALRQVAEDLPERFCRSLPVLREGAFQGQLRVAVLARQVCAAAGPLEIEQLCRAAEAFSPAHPLTIGELWALPALLRLELAENLVLTAEALLAGVPSSAQITDGTARIAAGVLGLRTLSTTDWKVFFERVSRVEHELRRDPAGVHARMDFATRDRYRREVEELARGSGRTEIEVARAAVELAGEARDGKARAGDVGFYLLDRGRPLLERRLGYRAPPAALPGRWIRRHPAFVYLSSITAVTLALALLPLGWAAVQGLSLPRFIVLGALLLFPAGTVAASVVNLLVTLSLQPRPLPRMGFEEDLPDDCRTLIVVPAMLTGEEEVRVLIQDLEVRFLGNAGRNLGFALLSDFVDAPAREMPGDGELLRCAADGIRELERRHGAQRFFLLHRERRWNPAEGVWMGWERKRGKLAELNRLLAGGVETSYTTFAGGDLAAFGPVRYVLTLDADTFLPREAAVRLAATLAHPLNQAEVDDEGRVAAGYTVLQPRVAVTPGGLRTRFARLFAGETGLDLYTRAVSDVFQDLFGIGIYAGKGIYEPAAFERSLAGRAPENALLSHDLFEGLHGRAGLVSDVAVLEDYPPNLLVSLRRLHRWMRGDWQLLPWLLPRVPAAGGARVRNRLPLIGRWMILENLHRSLFAPALLALLVLGWLWLPPAWIWTLAGVSTLAFPILLGGLAAGWRIVRGAPWGAGMADAAWSLRTGLAQALAALAVLPCEAFVIADAVRLTLARLAMRRHLLEWMTAAHAVRQLGERRSGAYWRAMAPAPALAAALAVLMAAAAPQALAAAFPVLLLWGFSPQLAAWLGRSPAPRQAPLAPAERRRLRLLARRTWHFYERFAGPEDHWLPPDNYQEEPGGIVAHRTSPTNVGMLLLSVLTAYDLGYVGADGMVARLRSLFATLEKLEGHRGHLWNWYDTRSLAPLEPRYVSTVDSGNLAACLLAVARGCRGAVPAPDRRPALCAGLADLLGVLAGLLGEAGPLASDLEGLAAQVEQATELREEVLASLERERLPQIEERILSLAETGSPPLDAARVAELGTWIERVHHHLEVMRRALVRSEDEAGRLRRELEELAARAEARALGMDFAFLFDPGRQLFRIGYNASTGMPDPNHYDLLASEARIASLLAIGKGDVPESHWVHLGRPFGRVGSLRTLLSWGGTMFELLMPRLLVQHPEGTPLEESCRATVARQIAFGRGQGIPWGMSESGYAELDAHRNYRYRTFGVPGLGFKRDLGDRLVVAPYATLLALPVAPDAVLKNLQRLAGIGALGRYGLYEALDYGPAPARPARPPKIVRSYMAHHQGMILTALDNALLGDAMVRRLHGDPRIATVDLLLHEQRPRYAPLRELPPPVVEAAAAPLRFAAAALGSWPAPAGVRPQAHVLSNGHYSVLVTSQGGGNSRWNGRVLVRGESDPAMERRGTRIYAEELGTGEVWPICGGQEGGEARFAMHMAELRSRHQGLSFRVTAAVSPSDDLEARLVFIVNETGQPRRLALTSYGEVVLAPSAEDRRHPAFGKLFVESEWAGDPGALCFRRRPRSPEEEPIVLAHTVVAGAVPRPEHPEGVRWETDRQRFLGRGGGYRRPFALGPGAPGLSGTTGATLDPVFALRLRVDLPPFGEAEVAFLTAAGRSRDAVLAVLDRHRSLARVHEVFEQARIHAGPELGEAGVRPEAARAVQELLSAVLQAHPALRAGPAVLAANRLGQPGLWPYGISGDRPILLLRVGRHEDSQLVREVLAAHALWRRRRVEIDLVILDEGATVYEQPLAEWLDREIARRGGGEWRDRPGGIFVVRAALMQPADRTLLEAVAAAVLDASRGDLEAWLRPLREAPEPAGLPLFVPVASSPLSSEATPPLERPEDLLFDNGLGGFMPGGRQYAIHLEPGRATPAPWSNVVANPGFGFLATESGGGFTWAVNSGENRLTPWRNDPVVDTPGEALYLRDEETGEVWTVTRLPAGADAACQTRHEAGATVYLQNSRGLEQELLLSVPREAPVKIAELRLTNLWQRPRRITATYFAEWVLGASRAATAAHVVSEYDGAAGALLARCPFPSGGERTAFLAASRPPHGLTADRAEFLGTPADRVRPAGLARIGLAGAAGPGLDPCAALQVHFDLLPGETVRSHFLLGQAADRGEALGLVSRYREPSAVEAARRESASFWDGVLGSVRISTPEPEIDRLANRWLLHQALSCRIWGRSAFYQPSGAFGFRDQLQDVLALLHAAPEITRAHLLESARHQFEAGDVLHWWHPPEGRGVRTRCSDDLLWLPYATAGYLAATGDRSILMEEVPFLAGPQLHPGEPERYDLYPQSGTSASLYEHCLRAIHRGTTEGSHGLPLIGAGDWNDGMNRVGEGGQGESVWLGWFLHAVLTGFVPVCEAMGDAGEADRLRRRAEALRPAIEASAWDGDWYLRAWYDDGTPLGSAANRECRIDLLAQAWAVLSQAADPARGLQAMDAAWRRLVRPEEGLTLLLAPPFDRTRHDPGYIKGYPPGVRENGGQYSHAAVWAAWAFARLGDGDRAMAVLRTIDPVYRTATPEGAERYRVEPYAVAGDVAGVPPHTGRGGWTWYTGTAAWTWRLIVEAILGLRRAAGVLEIDPCIPRSWPGFEAEIREGKALYRIRVENPDRVSRGVKELTLDGRPLAAANLKLADDGQEHEIAVQLGEARSLVPEEAGRQVG